MSAPKKLDIIGNGFDLHHGIPSAYKRFGAYVEDVDRTVYRLIDRYFSLDDKFWGEFETRLAEFDADLVMDDNSVYLASYGADDWSDAGHHDYEYEIEQTVRGLSKTLRAHFADWVRALPIPPASAVARPVPIDPTALFLTFNYTPTLQRTYGVTETRILHIHGRSADATSELVLGHGWARPAEERFSPGIDEDTDVRVAGGYGLLDDYFDSTFKPTARIIADNVAFFDALSAVEEIRVMGHSLMSVDAPYFEAIIDRIDLSRVRWKISVYDDPDGVRARAAVAGIPPARSQFLALSDF